MRVGGGKGSVVSDAGRCRPRFFIPRRMRLREGDEMVREAEVDGIGTQASLLAISRVGRGVREVFERE